MLIESVISELVQRALVVEITETEIEMVKQRQSLARLLAKFDRGTLGSRFLAEYDAVMRLSEIALLHNGYVFGNTPHLAMNIIARGICPSEDIRAMSKLRHSVKKGYGSPTEQDVVTIRRIRCSMLQALGD